MTWDILFIKLSSSVCRQSRACIPRSCSSAKVPLFGPPYIRFLWAPRFKILWMFHLHFLCFHYTQSQNQRDDSEIYAISLTSNILFNSLSNLAIKDIFKISRPSWFQNCPWLFQLMKSWMRYLRRRRRHKFPNRLVNFDFGCT